MPFVIDINEIVKERKKLPIEAFFVDTNIIYFYKDPFGLLYNDPSEKENQQIIEQAIEQLKSTSKAFSTISVAQEYYKHIQYNSIKFYKKISGKNNLSLRDFKNLRNSDQKFRDEWNTRIKDFKRIFSKTFKIYNSEFDSIEVIRTFENSKYDLVDWLLYKSVMSCDEKMKCIFTNDYDFYALDGNFHLLTSNQKIIKQAKADNKLQ